MANPAPAAPAQAAVRDRGFHPLRISRVVTETADTRSFELEVPEPLRSTFAYQAGQFCTFRVTVEGQVLLRCYSMSSTPGVDAALAVTVKRVPGGVVSNWMIDTLAAGDEIEVSPPAGVFRLTEGDGDVVAFAAGSGITPVFSMLKAGVATSRAIHLLYANRDRDGVIFGSEIDALGRRHADRLHVQHHFDADHGFIGAPDVAALVDRVHRADDADFYICGPTPFMDIVEDALTDRGVPAGRIHLERFTPAEPPVAVVADGPGSVGPPGTAETAEAAGTRVTIELDGRVDATDHHPGTTILQTARQLGLAPPYSCESGSCASCMAKLIEGDASMFVNDALSADEVADGWVLTCQAVPTSASVHVVYGYEET